MHEIAEAANRMIRRGHSICGDAGATEAHVAALEEMLSFRAPEGMRFVLRTYGLLRVGDGYVNGIMNGEIKAEARGGVWWETHHLRDLGLTERSVVISPFEDGGYYLDLDQPRDDGEYGIYSFEYIGMETMEVNCRSYTDFICSHILVGPDLYADDSDSSEF